MYIVSASVVKWGRSGDGNAIVVGSGTYIYGKMFL